MKEAGNAPNRLAKMPSPEKWLDSQQIAERGVKVNLKYPW
jgi:hypothetical protein